jgi:hypothetical protein
MDIPSNNEEPLKKCRVLYMGTALFNNNLENFDEKNINLNILQDTIAERYPVDGSNFAKGIFFLINKSDFYIITLSIFFNDYFFQNFLFKI